MKKLINICIVYALLIPFVLTSCSNRGNSRKGIENQLKFMIGKNIIFPDSLEFWKNGLAGSYMQRENILDN